MPSRSFAHLIENIVASPTVSFTPLTEAAGLADYGDPYHQNIFSFSSTTCDKSWAAEVIHHEIFHMIDIEVQPLLLPNASWKALNSSDFTYLKPALSYRSNTPGVVSAYAKTNEWEDKAETYAALMPSPHNVMALNWARSDSVLSEKFSAIKKALFKISDKYTE